MFVPEVVSEGPEPQNLVQAFLGRIMLSIVAYARVSTGDQRLDLQTQALTAAGADKIFEDQGVSGTKTSRPGLDAALAYLRDGDVLAVWRLDRLGRSTLHVLSLIQELGERGVGFRSLTESVDTTTPAGRLMLTLLAGLSSMEREITVERTKAGLDAARRLGRVGGRPRALTPVQEEQAQLMFKRGSSAVEIAAELGCGRATVYRALATS